MQNDYFGNVKEAAEFIRGKISMIPKAMLILSGGLTSFVDKIEEPVTISVKDVPHFPEARAEGHSGKMIFGKIGKLPLVVFQGRFHYYEGHPMQNVVFPIFAINELGAKTLIVTNAVGGINRNFKTGDIMVIRDHINFMGTNPLIGISTLMPENQFPDMREAYTKRLQEIAKKSAEENKLEIKEGVFIGTFGPSYETPAEIRMFRSWGADAVGMSVIPEVTTARFLKMETLGFSCIANQSADLHVGEMKHEDVLKAMKKLEGDLVKLLLTTVSRL